nr:hypothetical protein [Tanacetum cinerariifolium]
GNNVDEDEFMDEILNSQENPNPRLEAESHKERPAVAKSTDFINIDDKEEELAGDALERKKRKGIVEIKDTPPPILIRSPRTHTTPLSSNKEKLQELTISDPTPSSSKSTTSSPKLKQYQVKQYKSMFYKISRQYGYMFRHLKQSFMPRKDFSDINKGVHATLKEVVPKMVDQNTNDFMKNNLPRVVANTIKYESAKRQKTSEFGTNTTSESSSYQVMDESNPSGSGTQEELEDFDAWLNKQGIDDDEVSDDEVSTEEVSPELFAEVSERKMTIDDIQRMQNAVNITMRDQLINSISCIEIKPFNSLLRALMFNSSRSFSRNGTA